MPVAYAQQAFGPSNHSSVAPIFFSGHGESTDRANQQIALSPFGFPRQAQAQLATFCGYMQIWDFQTKSRLTAFSMNRFEDPGRILGPFILVHMQHVTYDKLQLFVMRVSLHFPTWNALVLLRHLCLPKTPSITQCIESPMPSRIRSLTDCEGCKDKN